jgi:hypothetical protein
MRNAQLVYNRHFTAFRMVPRIGTLKQGRVDPYTRKQQKKSCQPVKQPVRLLLSLPPTFLQTDTQPHACLNRYSNGKALTLRFYAHIKVKGNSKS